MNFLSLMEAGPVEGTHLTSQGFTFNRRKETETLSIDTYLFLLLIKIINDDANEKVQSEEGATDDKNHKIDVHIFVSFPFGLVFHLQIRKAH